MHVAAIQVDVRCDTPGCRTGSIQRWYHRDTPMMIAYWLAWRDAERAGWRKVRTEFGSESEICPSCAVEMGMLPDPEASASRGEHERVPIPR